MKVYTVGGAVRDQLLGLAVSDRDYVVVGATPEQMLALDYTPVGKDFPVFLHPRSHAEYALARTERKTAPGYKGFVFHTSPEVTLEQDLIRRDLTINAMAQDEAGHISDPYGGQRDLADKVFRHVSDAFAEDPVRILRVARFAARFSDFHVASETNALMRRMVDAGEVDALVPERVWQELARGLMEAKPSRMFAVLHACGALQRILPELAAVLDSGVMPVIDYAARQHYALPIRVAALLQGLHPAGTLSTTTTTTTTTSTALDAHATEAINLLEQVCERLKIPNDCRDLARMRVREHATLQEAFSLDAAKLVRLLERCDAFRKPQRYMEMLISAESTEIAQLGDAARPWAQRAYLTALLQAAQSVNAGQVAALHPNAPEQIALAIHAARVAAVRVFQAQTAG